MPNVVAKDSKHILPKYALVFCGGEKKIELDSNKLTGEFCEQISDAVGAIRGEEVDYAEDKYPMEEGELYEDWIKRVAKDTDNDFMMRREGESIQEHVIRVNKPKLGNQVFAWKLLNWYAKATGQVELTESEFKKAIYARVRESMYKFFVTQGEIPVLELYPKS